MKHKVSLQKDGMFIHLSGHIDETAEDSFHTIVKDLKAKKVTAAVIDCRDVGVINSLGIVAWHSFVTKDTKNVSLTYQNCPQSMVDTAIMFPDFFGKGELKSFFVNYYCDDCRSRFSQSVLVSDMADMKAFPKKACSSCHKDIDSEEDTEVYESLLAR